MSTEFFATIEIAIVVWFVCQFVSYCWQRVSAKHATSVEPIPDVDIDIDAIAARFPLPPVYEESSDMELSAPEAEVLPDPWETEPTTVEIIVIKKANFHSKSSMLPALPPADNQINVSEMSVRQLRAMASEHNIKLRSSGKVKTKLQLQKELQAAIG